MTDQRVNSYKRLAGGLEAPGQVSWTRQGRSALVRVPSSRPSQASAARIELRETLGERLCDRYVRNKRREWEEFSRIMTELERRRHLRVF